MNGWMNEWMNEWKVYYLKLYNFCEWEQWLSMKKLNACLNNAVHETIL